MSFWHGSPVSSVADTFAGGVATLEDIFGAGVDQAAYVDNAFAANAALDRAIEERNDEVFKATGTRPDNPLRRAFGPVFEESRRTGEDVQKNVARAIGAWQDEIATAAARIPDGAVAARLNRSIEADAIRIGSESDERLGRLMASRPGIGGWAAMLGGALTGGMRDPMTVASLMLGGAPGAGRTVAGRILTTAATEAFVNGATEAAMQPQVQAWREKLGLEHGPEQAAINIGTAALFGGLLGAAGQGVGELARVLAPIRPALAPEARGALDQAETLAHAEALRPPGAAPATHDDNLSVAHRIAGSDPGEALPRFEPDAGQVERVSRTLLPETAEDGAPRQSLVEFLAAQGGVIEEKGELAAIGAEALARRRGGADRRMSLDHARQAAEEAGYIGRPGETQTTSVRDLLDAIDQEMRGRPVHARGEEGAARADADAERAAIESAVHEVIAQAGPGVDDALVRRAAELVLREGTDAGDALERVLTHAELAGLPKRPVLNITRPADFAPDLWNGVKRQVANAMRAWASERFAGRTVQNVSDGSQIMITRAGIKHATSRDTTTRRALAAMWGLDRLLETARYSHSEADKLGRAEIRGVHIYSNDIAVDGHAVELRIVVREDRVGRRYYDHSEIGKGGGPAAGNGPPDGPLVPTGQGPPDANIARGGDAGNELRDEPLPGWSPEELDRLSGPPGPEPKADPASPFDDPAAPLDEEFLVSDADLERFGNISMPGEDGATTLRTVLDDIDREKARQSAVRSCPI